MVSNQTFPLLTISVERYHESVQVCVSVITETRKEGIASSLCGRVIVEDRKWTKQLDYMEIWRFGVLLGLNIITFGAR